MFITPPLKKGGEGGLFNKRNAIYYKISTSRCKCFAATGTQPSFSKRGTLEVPIFMSQTQEVLHAGKGAGLRLEKFKIQNIKQQQFISGLEF
jgi:hypothetical protein